MNAPPTYQRLVNHAFKAYLNDFMKLFLEYFNVYSNVDTHLTKLQLYFDRCREYGLSLNLDKCLFVVASGMILGSVVSKEGKFLDPKEIQAILDMPTSTDAHVIQMFSGLAVFNRSFIHNYVKIMAPTTKLTRTSKIVSVVSRRNH